MNVVVFWVVEPCTLVVLTDVSEETAASIIRDGGRKPFRNVGQYLPDYTAQHSWRQSPSDVSPSEQKTEAGNFIKTNT
jgi:hypothetical protein